MRLDHLSYAAGPEGLGACAQRLGAQLGASFTDGGIHPRFGTRNFVLPLFGGAYVEVVAALDHPAVDQAPFGRAVRARTETGGGWFSWVVGVDGIHDLASVEQRFGREAAAGHRVRPDGFDLRWKQIGIKDTASDLQLPWFIHWESDPAQHPGAAGSQIELVELTIAGERDKVVDFLGYEATAALEDLHVHWIDIDENDGDSGIVAAHFYTPRGSVTVD